MISSIVVALRFLCVCVWIYNCYIGVGVNCNYDSVDGEEQEINREMDEIENEAQYGVDSVENNVEDAVDDVEHVADFGKAAVELGEDAVENEFEEKKDEGESWMLGKVSDGLEDVVEAGSGVYDRR